MQTPKMIVTDLDGTLLDIDKNCSDKTKKYLQKLKNEGTIIVIATGRILNSAIQVTGGAKFANYIISNAGGMVYDVVNQKEIFRTSISKEDIKKICSCYDEKFEYIDICNSMYYNKYTKENYEDSEFSKVIKNIEDFISTCNDIIHIGISVKEDKNIEEIINEIKPEITHLEIKIMQDSFSNRRWIEIYKPNLSKYRGIQKIAEIENIDNKDIIAFGDGLNDIDMIKNCGIGVAMGNSLNEVKNVADYLTISHNEDGVVYFLEKLYGGNNEISYTKS